jgi:signal transduction histidine kinase
MRWTEWISEAGFMPHGHCYLWRADLLWLHTGSDLSIALAYYSIPVVLVAFARRRPEVQFGWLLWMFGAFIFLCGTTHVMEIVTTWKPLYVASGLVKLATAAISVATAAALWPVLPRALALPTQADLEAVNEGLRRVHGELEERVRLRTAALEEANGALREYSERLERSNRELDEFAHVVSHDLKAPLRGIVALVHWIADDNAGALSPASVDHMKLLVQRTERMNELIDGVLEYSRIGRAGEHTERVDADACVRQIVEMLDVPEGTTLRVDGALPPVDYDRVQLVQIFQNLILNAIHHSGRSDATIVIAGRESGAEVEFSVSDDGAGIDARHHERIFRMFQSLHADADGAGVGIGLAIVKKSVERHGGRVWVESAPGAGSSFRFTAPRAAA